MASCIVGGRSATLIGADGRVERHGPLAGFLAHHLGGAAALFGHEDPDVAGHLRLTRQAHAGREAVGAEDRRLDLGGRGHTLGGLHPYAALLAGTLTPAGTLDLHAQTAGHSQ